MKRIKSLFIQKIILLMAMAAVVLSLEPIADCMGSDKKEACRTSVGCKVASAKKKKSDTGVSVKERNKFFAASAFVGNSLGEGLEIYFSTKPDGFLGNPLMLVKKNYSFANDASSTSIYRPDYKGKLYPAREAIALSGVKRVFINMGTNDLGQASQVYKAYVRYIKGIQKDSKGIEIFIQSTTPVCVGEEKISNKEVRALNRKMKAYCKKHKNIYYVNIAKGLKDGNGALRTEYSSDRKVHMNMQGYEVWTDNLIQFAKNHIEKKKNAKEAVKVLKTELNRDTYEKAVRLVKKLEKSDLKDKLTERLAQYKKQLEEEEESMQPPESVLRGQFESGTEEGQAQDIQGESRQQEPSESLPEKGQSVQQDVQMQEESTQQEPSENLPEEGQPVQQGIQIQEEQAQETGFDNSQGEDETCAKRKKDIWELFIWSVFCLRYVGMGI